MVKTYIKFSIAASIAVSCIIGCSKGVVSPVAVNESLSTMAKTSPAATFLDIGVSANDNVWIVNKDLSQSNLNGVLKLQSAWKSFTGAGYAIQGDIYGNAWLVNGDFNLYHSRSDGGWDIQSKQAQDVGVSCEGIVWIVSNELTSDGGFEIYELNSSGNGWIDMYGTGKRIAVDWDGNAWVVNSKGNLYKYSGTGWDLQTIGNGVLAKDIGVGPIAFVYVVTIDGKVQKRLSPYSWQDMNITNIAAISVDYLGNPWVVDNNKMLFKYDNGNWSPQGDATDIGCGPEGTIWKTTSSPSPGGYTVLRKNFWEGSYGHGIRLAAGLNGSVWRIDEKYNLFYDHDGISEIQSKSARDVGVGANGTVWIISNEPASAGNYFIYQLAGSTWKKPDVANSGIRIAVDPAGYPWVVNSNYDLFQKLPGKNGAWKKQSKKARDVGIGADGSVCIISNESAGGGYLIYKLINSVWTYLHGAGTSISCNASGNPWCVNSSGDAYEYQNAIWYRR